MVERLSVMVGSDELSFETGKIGKQAAGAVMVTHGETMVLSTCVVAPEGKEGQDFFPLTVDYREKSSSAGRIPGNFFRREGRPSEREVLTSRLTDRPIRPLFPKGFTNEVQVFSTVFSADNIHDPAVMSINGASAALHISKIPFDGPVGAVRVCMFGEELVINPPMEEAEDADLDLVIAGTKDAIMMVEGRAYEVTEDEMVRALDLGHEWIGKICDAIEELRRRVGQEKMPFEPPQIDENLLQEVERRTEEHFRRILAIAGKKERQDALSTLKKQVCEEMAAHLGEEQYEDSCGKVGDAFEKTLKRLMRAQVVNERTRIDGRGLTDIRPISIEVGILPRAHGSCLFTRGETQALVTATLGTSRDEQRLDELTGEEFRRFMLHYNFPNWSVGEVRRIGGPGRREVGHGKLAERALAPMVPVADDDVEEDEETFPYTVRVVSDITESNGSSSMATVCGGSLALMDAGVPVHAAVAGIAMGLIKEGDEIRILSDIMGTEDHLGDMDFKVAGTREGITAFQLDMKVHGLSSEVMRQALEQAKQGRLHILAEMDKVLAEPRPEISKYAPRIYTIKIDVDKIRDVIGPGGKVVRDIQAQTNSVIDIEDDGTINVAATDEASAQAAIDMIKAITASVEIGKIYKGTVTRIMNFGAFVSIIGNKEGLVHISELAPRRVEEVTDVVQVGDPVHVKVVEIDRMGRINLSKVEAERELGLISPEDEVEAGNGDIGERRGGGNRDRDRQRSSGGGGGGDRRRGGGGGGRPRGGERRGGGGGGGGRPGGGSGRYGGGGGGRNR